MPQTLFNTKIGDVTLPIASTSPTTMTLTGTTIPGLLRGTTPINSTSAHPTPQGVMTIGSTAAKNYVLGPNVPGTDVELICTANGTASKKVAAAAGVTILGFLSSAAGSSKAKTSLNFTGLGQMVHMRALSSAVFQVISKSGAVASS